MNKSLLVDEDIKRLHENVKDMLPAHETTLATIAAANDMTASFGKRFEQMQEKTESIKTDSNILTNNINDAENDLARLEKLNKSKQDFDILNVSQNYVGLFYTLV